MHLRMSVARMRMKQRYCMMYIHRKDSFLFNIYMKLQGQVICWPQIQYYYCADDTQLHILTLVWPGDAVKILCQCLENVWPLVGKDRLWLKPDKTGCLRLFSFSELGVVPSLVLNVIVLPLLGLACRSW